MKKRKLWLTIALAGAVVGVIAAVLGIVFGGGGGKTTEQPLESTVQAEVQRPVLKREETNIWISLPDMEDSHWDNAGTDLKMLFENLGYPVTLSYAGGDAQEQAKQMQQAVEQGADCMIVAAVDSTALYDAAQMAGKAHIPVIAYDRLLMDSGAVSYYVSYDYKAIGRAIAEAIVNNKQLATAGEGESYTIEFFMGSPESSNALLLYQGVMEVLRPYLDSGVLVSKSGRTAFEDTCVVDWAAANAGKALKSYQAEYYPETIPDILCTVSDSFADACIQVLEEMEWPLENWPVITGMGATKVGTAHLHEGKQTASVATDLMELNERCVQLVDDLLTGKTPEVNDTENCFNNTLIVPAYLVDYRTVIALDGPAKQEQTNTDEGGSADADHDGQEGPTEAAPTDATSPAESESTQPSETTAPTQTTEPVSD